MPILGWMPFCRECRVIKMNNKSLFTWRPDYEVLTHAVKHHPVSRYCDDLEQWSAVFVLRKRGQERSSP